MNCAEGPRSAFGFYSDLTGNDIIQGNPEIERKGLCKQLYDQWTKMNESERQPYYDLAQKDKERCDNAKFRKHLNQKCSDYSKELKRANSVDERKFHYNMKQNECAKKCPEKKSEQDSEDFCPYCGCPSSFYYWQYYYNWWYYNYYYGW